MTDRYTIFLSGTPIGVNSLLKLGGLNQKLGIGTMVKNKDFNVKK